MGFRNIIAKILFGSLAGDGKKREPPKAGSQPYKSGIRRQGINPLVRNCDEYDEVDYRADYCETPQQQCASVRLARDFTEK